MSRPNVFLDGDGAGSEGRGTKSVPLGKPSFEDGVKPVSDPYGAEV